MSIKLARIPSSSQCAWLRDSPHTCNAVKNNIAAIVAVGRGQRRYARVKTQTAVKTGNSQAKSSSPVKYQAKSSPPTRTQAAQPLQYRKLLNPHGQYVELPPIRLSESRNKHALAAANDLLGSRNEIMLYAAPSHGSALVSSASAGIMFLKQSGSVAAGMLTGSFSWWLKAPTLFGSVVCMTIGWVMVSTSARQINKLRLVRDPKTNEPKLQFQTKWRFLFWQPRYVTVAIGDVHADRAINDPSPATYNVEMDKLDEWTKFERDLETRTWREAVKSFNSKLWAGLTDPLQTLKRDTGRMFYRQGMAFLVIDGQEYKLDLFHAYLLEHGAPFRDFIPIVKEGRQSMMQKLRLQLTSS